MHCHIREDRTLKEAEHDIWKIWIEFICVYWQEVLKFRYQEDLDRAVDLAFGVFHLDIEHCTLALLMQVLPQYLYNRMQWVSTVHFTLIELIYSVKLIVSHLVKFCTFYCEIWGSCSGEYITQLRSGMWHCNGCSIKSMQLFPILKQMNPFHTYSHSVFNDPSLINLLCMFGCSRWSVTFRFLIFTIHITNSRSVCVCKSSQTFYR